MATALVTNAVVVTRVISIIIIIIIFIIIIIIYTTFERRVKIWYLSNRCNRRQLLPFDGD